MLVVSLEKSTLRRLSLLGSTLIPPPRLSRFPKAVGIPGLLDAIGLDAVDEKRQGNLLQEYEQRFEKLSEDQKSRLCSEDNSSMHFRHQEKKEINLYAKNIRCLEIKKELVSNGGSKAMYDLAQSPT